MGHVRPFEFEDKYAPAEGIRRFLWDAVHSRRFRASMSASILCRCRMQDREKSRG